MGNEYDIWLDVPEKIMKIGEPTEFYHELLNYLTSINELYRIKYVEGNQVKVMKGYKI